MTIPNPLRAFIVVALLFAAAGSTRPAAAAVPPAEIDPRLENLESADVPVLLRFERKPLSDVLDALSDTAVNLKVVGEGCGRSMLISVDYPLMPLKEALARLAAATGVAFEVSSPRKLRVICPVALKGGMTPPERIAKVEPVFPTEETPSGIARRVLLQAVIDTVGDVTYVTVLRGVIGHPAFEESAVEAVKQWKYRPALRDGKPVPIYVTIEIEFTPPAKSG